jgi:hypothetical protein
MAQMSSAKVGHYGVIKGQLGVKLVTSTYWSVGPGTSAAKGHFFFFFFFFCANPSLFFFSFQFQI